jgi:hypothetical protein|tara:strand:+ start:296 stop:493 length:198 start_codon:yes stop_codon:yes gene_type:complete
MKSNHKILINDKQVEFLIKCIDISQSTQSLKPDKSESDLIRELTKLNEEIQDDKLGNDSIFYDLN